MRLTRFILILSAVVMISLSGEWAAAKPKARSYTFTRKVGRTQCVFNEDKSRWLLAKRLKSGLFKLLKRPSNVKKRKGYNKRKRKCKRQSDPTSATIVNLPGGGDFIPEVTSSSAVSGTPPAYTTITDSSALTTYWREVDGANVVTALGGSSPTTNQCNEFRSGPTDGSSAGLNACNANIDALRAVVKPLEAALPACYLSRAATQSNLDGGGISLVGDSSFPGSAVENLFTPPSSSSARVIKLQIRNGDRDSDIFVQIDGTATLATESLDYRVKLYGCDDDPTADPSTFDQISVSSDGSFVASTAGLRDGQISITLRGTVSYNSETGEYEYDSSAGNTADIVFINEGSSASNKYNVTVQSGTIMIKLMEIGSTSQRNGIAKIGYLGGVSDLAMTQGGTKWQTLTNNVETESSSGGFEYRDTRYASAPSNSFLSDIQSTDFSTDEFYLSNPSFSLDTSDFSCGTIPDVTVQIDMSSSTMQAIQDECEGFIPTNTRFCESDAIDDAETGFETNCSS